MPAEIDLRLDRREPFAGDGLLGVLAARAATGLERLGTDGSYTRTMRLAGGAATVTVWPAGDGDHAGGPPPRSPGTVRCVLRLAESRDRDAAVRLVRRLLDLDADPATVDAHLATDPALAPLVARRPGLRVLGTVDGFELALRAVIGQQVSVAAARTVLGRIVVAHGEPVGAELDPETGAVGGSSPSGPATVGGPLRLLPAAATIAGLPDEALPMPRARAATVRRLATAVASGELDLGSDADPGEAVAALLALPGIGPLTAAYVAMRALRDPDAFPATDLVLRRSAEALGLPSDARRLAAHAERWSPWRAYAAQHLWAAAADPVG
jgi:AraC family transcriptional regulator of adaptative response / DNA-3-methyladenine glycosylase II